MTARLRVLSGLGAKSAACFLVEAPQARLVLDLGAVADPAGNPALAGIGPVEAVLLGHLHPDHAGALARLSEIGNPPVHATALTGRLLGRDDLRPLPLRGTVRIGGVSVTCGRNGHAPGGVWLHLALGDGLLYCGDLAFGSEIWPLDAPPPAATVVLDASFGAAPRPEGPQGRTLAAALEAARGPGGGPLLLPAPAAGRGLEIALAAQRAGAPVALDAEHRRVLAATLAAPEALRPGADDALRRLAGAAPAETAPARPGLAVLVDDPGARGPLAAAWCGRIAAGGGAIAFTGHVPPRSPGARLLAARRARRLPWAVHPWAEENRGLLARCGARAALPAFCASEAHPALAAALAPADLVTCTEVAL